MKKLLLSGCGGCGSKKGKKGKKGFTLIELLIVITIIGILAVALLPRVLNAPARARDTQRRIDLSRISLALESYYNDFGKYPVASSGICLSTATGTIGVGEQLAAYFTVGDFPVDPLGGVRTYVTETSSNTCATASTGYWYRSLILDSNNDMAYVLSTDTEIDPVTTATSLAPGYMAAGGELGTATADTSYAIVKAAVDTGEESPIVYAIVSK